MVAVVGLTLPYAHLDLDRALLGLAAAGFTEIGVGWAHRGEDPLDRGGAGAAALRTKLDDRGLHAAVIGFGNPGEGSRVDHLRRSIEAAHVLGAGTIQMAGVNSYRRFPDEPIDEAELAGAYQQYQQDLASVADEAGKAGVTITLKPHTGNTGTGPKLAAVVAAIDHPAVRAAYDPGNVSFYEGLDPVEDMQAAVEVVAAFVAKDHRGGRAVVDFPPPGEGTVDFPALFTQLRAHNFTGPVIVERVTRAAADHSPTELDQLLTDARNYLVATLTAADLPIHEGKSHD